MISSVRRGLEAERDALPGLITALGHKPIRFEDLGAQPVPSREACLQAVNEADPYLLLLGPHYGHIFTDTGQSATHDEFIAAQAKGIPRRIDCLPGDTRPACSVGTAICAGDGQPG